MDKSIINIALSADIKYAEQVITLIKSACYHHQNVHFYLFNKEYPTEWFDALNAYLARLNSYIFDVKVTLTGFDQYRTMPHITEAAFYRYLIPNLAVDRILYLDCDIIIDGNLTDFYFYPFGNALAIAVPDMVIQTVKSCPNNVHNIKPYFNSGVILMNNVAWRKEHLTRKLFDLTNQDMAKPCLDQNALNFLLKGRWLIAPRLYNFQTAAAYVFRQNGYAEVGEQVANLHGEKPIIIHYTDVLKPWLTPYQDMDVAFRERYWFYYRLQWQDIIDQHTSG